MPSFLTANIDRAIVLTQFDLRGFMHPLGFRIEEKHPKYLEATTANLVAFAAGYSGGKRPTVKPYVRFFDCTFEEYLDMCRKFAADCDLTQKEAIQLIVKEIVRQNRWMRAQIKNGKMKPSLYLHTLDKDNRWGRAVIALSIAFEVNPARQAAA